MKLLDLFCGAGGAAMGYHRAGFEVVGVDIKPQKHYPFEFHQADAFDYLRDHGHEFDVIHASPPCQHYSRGSAMKGTQQNHDDLVGDTRELLHFVGRPWIIENVYGAPLNNPVMLCGTQFALKVYRHRYFEHSSFLWQPYHFPHCDSWPIRTGNKEISKNGFMTIAGHHSHTARGAEAMGIDWMNRYELAQAIPPAYTEWIGKQLLKSLGHTA
jgi:DNA (cytosine-5)-methyltransferase 1